MIEIRCFIGFFLPEEVRDGIVDIQTRLSKAHIKAKMVEKENLHVNVSYLGETGEDDLETIASDLNSICAEHKRFDIKMGELVAFPSKDHARVVFMNSVDPSGGLKSITEEIVSKIGGDSKPPHITLCRVKKIEDKAGFSSIFDRFEYRGPKTIEVVSMSLIESVLTPDGPVYVVRKESKLGH